MSFSRFACSRDIQRDFAAFGKSCTLYDDDGKPFQWDHADAGKSPQWVMARSDVYQRMVLDALDSAKGSKLKVALYYDEIVPGRGFSTQLNFIID